MASLCEEGEGPDHPPPGGELAVAAHGREIPPKELVRRAHDLPLAAEEAAREVMELQEVRGRSKARWG
jgi:hypothetical protein